MTVGSHTGAKVPLAGPAAGFAEQVLQALSGIQYGSVEIVIHDSKIVQIVRKERVRFDCEPRPRGR